MCCWHGCTCHDNEYDSSTEPTGMLGVNTHSVKLYEKVMAMLGCTQCSSWKTRCEVFDGSIWCLVFDVSIRRCAGRKGNQCSFSSCISQVSCSLRTTPFMSFNHKKAQGLGASISCTDDRLSGLPLVFKMPRLLRLLAHRKYWKSSQWHNWLLHFSPLCYLEYFHSHTIVAGWNSHAWCISFLQTVCLLIFWSEHRSTFFFLFLNEYEALYGKEKVTLKPILSCISLTVLGSGIFCGIFQPIPIRTWTTISYDSWALQDIQSRKFIFLPMPKLYETSDFIITNGCRLRVHCTVMPEYTLTRKGWRTRLQNEYKKVVVTGFTISVNELEKSHRIDSYVQVVRWTCIWAGHIYCSCTM